MGNGVGGCVYVRGVGWRRRSVVCLGMWGVCRGREVWDVCVWVFVLVVNLSRKTQIIVNSAVP